MQMQIYTIVMKLIGEVMPTGSHEVDQQRLANMKELTELIDRLLFEVQGAAHYATRQEASMKAIGSHAKQFMFELSQHV